MKNYIIKNKENNQLKNIKSIILTLTIVLSPILTIYNIKGIPGSYLDIAIVLIVLLYFKNIFDEILSISRIKFIILLFLFLSFIISLILTRNLNIIPFFLRYIIYILIIMFLIKDNFNIEFAFSVLKYVSIFACVYSLLQIIFINLLQINLPNIIPFLNNTNTYLDNSHYINYPQYFRPCSFFLEPSHFSEYVLIYIYLAVFFQKKEILDYLSCIFCIFCIFISGSTLGIVMVIICIMISIVLRYKIIINRISNLKNKYKFLAAIFAIVLVLVIIFSSQFQIFVTRFFIDGSAFERIKNIFLVNKNMDALNIIFGNGMDLDIISQKYGYLPSISLVFACFGILGIIIFFMTCYFIFVKYKKRRVLFIMFLIMCVFTEIFFVSYFLLYMSFILVEENKYE